MVVVVMATQSAVNTVMERCNGFMWIVGKGCVIAYNDAFRQ